MNAFESNDFDERMLNQFVSDLSEQRETFIYYPLNESDVFILGPEEVFHVQTMVLLMDLEDCISVFKLMISLLTINLIIRLVRSIEVPWMI